MPKEGERRTFDQLVDVFSNVLPHLFLSPCSLLFLLSSLLSLPLLPVSLRLRRPLRRRRFRSPVLSPFQALPSLFLPDLLIRLLLNLTCSSEVTRARYPGRSVWWRKGGRGGGRRNRGRFSGEGGGDGFCAREGEGGRGGGVSRSIGGWSRGRRRRGEGREPTRGGRGSPTSRLLSSLSSDRSQSCWRLDRESHPPYSRG